MIRGSYNAFSGVRMLDRASSKKRTLVNLRLLRQANHSTVMAPSSRSQTSRYHKVPMARVSRSV